MPGPVIVAAYLRELEQRRVGGFIEHDEGAGVDRRSLPVVTLEWQYDAAGQIGLADRFGRSPVHVDVRKRGVVQDRVRDL